MANNFDIEVAKAELEEFKHQYNDIMYVYSYVKTQSLPKQIFPSIEAKIHDIQKAIENRTVLIANYEDLQNTLKTLEEFEDEFKEWNKVLD
jgi:hypothetical protein